MRAELPCVLLSYIATLPPRWGALAFALVVAVIFALGGRSNPLITLAIDATLSLVVAEASYRVVERPSHGFARSVGRRVAGPGARPHFETTLAPAGSACGADLAGW